MEKKAALLMGTIFIILVVALAVLVLTDDHSDDDKSKRTSKVALASNHDKKTTLTINEDDAMFLSDDKGDYHIAFPHFIGKAYGEDRIINYIISMDEALVPIIGKNDKIIGNVNATGKKLKIMPVSFAGYSPLVLLNSDGTAFVGKNEDGALDQTKALVSSLQIYPEKSDDEIFKNFKWMGLPYGQRLEVLWDDQNSTISHALKTQANCSVYLYNGKDDVFTLSPTESKKDRQTFDLSSLNSGYYAIFDSDDGIYSIIYKE